METESTATSISPASNINSDHNSIGIIPQNNQKEPISSELINLDICNTLHKAYNWVNRASYNPSGSSQKCHRHDYGRSQSVPEEKGTTTRSLTGHIKSHPEGLKEFLAAQRIPDPCRSVKKLHELLPDCEKVSGPSHYLQVTEWMASIDGKEEYDGFNSRMEEKQPSTTHTGAKPSFSNQRKQFQHEKSATSS
ncbi:hypothetical protein O181_004745 [Austropuccinia psidii MF-1]|uniref:Uncharacterized protein n=1 Tax=Austropuccinia psidii MF-1 TaxID=1389203 RepID=A0A9Q3BHL5_9BASI|nr:hypothetical protein [Austropuccinia psidii MF-1]